MSRDHRKLKVFQLADAYFSLCDCRKREPGTCSLEPVTLS